MRQMILAAMLAALAQASWAETYSGKLDLLEVKAEGTRFFVRSEKLHLFATGAYMDALMAGYFRKATFTVGYQTFPCGGGTVGKCGTVHLVEVEQSGF
jgi:hypothetical protein